MPDQEKNDEQRSDETVVMDRAELKRMLSEEMSSEPTAEDVELAMDAIAAKRNGDGNERKSESQKQRGFNPNAGREGVQVTGHAADGDQAMREMTADLFRAIIKGNATGIDTQRVQKQLFEGGHYRGQRFKEMTRDGFTTLLDDSGGVFLPTTISQEIFNILDEVGVVPGNAMQMPIPRGREKIPNVSGDLTFFPIVEGAEMKARKFSFGGIQLDPLQWGVLVPWTLKMEREAGARLVPIVQQKIAEASARAKDDTFLNGDGTSDYHNIKGVFTRADDGDIQTETADSGATSFGALDPTDFLLLQKQLPASIRAQGIYVFHSDRRYDLLQLKDANDRYYYFNPNETRENADVLWGRPVEYTETGPNTDSSGEYIGCYFHPDYLAWGTGQNLATDRLTEATITDVDDSTDIRLGAQYSAALRVIEEWDLEFGLEQAFAAFKLA